MSPTTREGKGKEGGLEIKIKPLGQICERPYFRMQEL